jgi:hypothetical protein
MVKTLELALSTAASLPEAAQEQLGRELLERIESLAGLRAEIDIGIRELDAGLGEELDIDDLIRQARAEHAGHAEAPAHLGAEGEARLTRGLALLRPRGLSRKLPTSCCATLIKRANGWRSKQRCGERAMT